MRRDPAEHRRHDLDRLDAELSDIEGELGAMVVRHTEEIERVNRLAAKQWPEQAVFAPREVSAAVIRATPTVISVIDLAMGPGQPDLVHVASETTVYRAHGNAENGAGAGSMPLVDGDRHAAQP